jgi:hydrogenase nickel incorporation protein HypB
MCRDCGCSDPNRQAEAAHAHHHAHEHEHDGHEHHRHHHEHAGDSKERTIDVQRSLLELNDHLALHNRERFAEAGVLVLNLMSSPGAGKTRLLELTLSDLADRLRMAVIVGDLETDNDARRLRVSGAPVKSITTGTMCHLEADMISHAAEEFNLEELDVLFIENVGNLVCPASFDLGESLRVVLMSVTEGEDKPLKYPPMFKAADVVLLTKMDLVNATWFDLQAARENIRRVAPQAEVIEVSALNGDGLEEWYRCLLERAPQHAEVAKAGIVDGAEI